MSGIIRELEKKLLTKTNHKVDLLMKFKDLDRKTRRKIKNAPENCPKDCAGDYPECFGCLTYVKHQFGQNKSGFLRKNS